MLNRISRVVSLIKSGPLKQRVSKTRTVIKKDVYLPAPKVSVILQCFNHRRYVEEIIHRLVVLPVDEIIVIDDGSLDGTWQAVLPLLNGKNHFMIRSNDLFEVRMYDRALSLARGKFAALLQDDDLPPQDPGWINQAVRYFETDPRLLILGGRVGLEILTPDEAVAGDNTAYQVVGDLAGQPGVNKYRIISPDLALRETGFQYVMAVNRAPMWVRREEFIRDIGIDQAFAPFQCDDVDACLRAWNNAWRVGLYPAGFSKLGEGGMKMFNSSRVGSQANQNWAEIYRRYGTLIESGAFQQMVAAANCTSGSEFKA